MENLYFEETDDSPRVRLDQQSGMLELSGKSLPEDVASFYQPVLDWIVSYSKKPQPETEISVKLTYFNTASSKILLDIFNILEKMHEDGNKVTVNWYYPEYDEDMKDTGVEYSGMVELPFKHIIYHP